MTAPAGNAEEAASLVAELGDAARTERVLASVAGQYAARQRADGVSIQAAAWLVTACRARAGPG